MTRVAIVRLDALGDTLLSTPAIDYLGRQVGAENVFVLVSPGLGSIFGDKIAHREVDPGLSEHDLAALIDDFAPDIVFVFSEKKRALRGAHLSRAAQKIGFDPGWSQPLRSLEVKRFLTVRFPIINSLESASRYHEVERYCRLVGKGLSHKYINGAGLQLFALKDKPVPHASGPLGFQWARKWLQDGWPEQMLLSVLETLPVGTMIFVAPGEKEWALSLLPKTRRSDLVCEPELLDYARRMAACRYLLSIDTGAVHLAAAVGTPVIDVFSEQGAQHTVPRWRPWMVPHQIVLKPGPSAGEEVLLSRIATAQAAMESVLEWQQQRQATPS